MAEEDPQRAGAHQLVQDLRRLLFIHREEQLAPDPLARYRAEGAGLDRVAHAAGRVRLDRESEPDGQADRAEDPRRIVEEALIVKDPDHTIAEIASPGRRETRSPRSCDPDP